MLAKLKKNIAGGDVHDARAFGAVDATSGRVVLPSHLAADLPPSITADTDRALLCSRCGRTEGLVADEAVATCGRSVGIMTRVVAAMVGIGSRGRGAC